MVSKYELEMWLEDLEERMQGAQQVVFSLLANLGYEIERVKKVPEHYKVRKKRKRK